MSAPLNIDAIQYALPHRRIDYHHTIDSTMRAAAGLPTRRVEAWHYTDLRASMA